MGGFQKLPSNKMIAGSPRYKLENTRTALIKGGLKDLEVPTDSTPSVTYKTYHRVVWKLSLYSLDQQCPTGLFPMMEMFCICNIQLHPLITCSY